MELVEKQASIFSIQKYKRKLVKVTLERLNLEFLLNYHPKFPIGHEQGSKSSGPIEGPGLCKIVTHLVCEEFYSNLDQAGGMNSILKM